MGLPGLPDLLGLSGLHGLWGLTGLPNILGLLALSSEKINSQSLGDTQVEYISQKFTLKINTLLENTLLKNTLHALRFTGGKWCGAGGKLLEIRKCDGLTDLHG